LRDELDRWQDDGVAVALIGSGQAHFGRSFAEDFELTASKAGKIEHCITPDFYTGDYRGDQLQVELFSPSNNIYGSVSYGFNTAFPTTIIAAGTEGSLMMTGHYSVIVPLSKPQAPNPKKEISAWVGARMKKVKGKLKRLAGKGGGGGGGKPIQEKVHYRQIQRVVQNLREGSEFDVTPEKARSVVRLWQEITSSYESK